MNKTPDFMIVATTISEESLKFVNNMAASGALVKPPTRHRPLHGIHNFFFVKKNENDRIDAWGESEQPLLVAE